MGKFVLLTACCFCVLANFKNVEGMEETLIKEKAPKKNTSMTFKFNFEDFKEDFKNIYLNVNGQEIDLKNLPKSAEVVQYLKKLVNILGADMQKQGNSLKRSEQQVERHDTKALVSTNLGCDLIKNEEAHREPNVQESINQKEQKEEGVNSVRFEGEVKRNESDYDDIYWKFLKFADKMSLSDVSKNYGSLSEEFTQMISNINLDDLEITSKLYEEAHFKFIIAMLLINVSKCNVQILKEILVKIDVPLCEDEKNEVECYQEIGKRMINDISNYDNAAIYTGKFYESI